MIYTFPMGICSKVNVIARLEIELAYYDVAVQNVIHCAMRIHTWGNKTLGRIRPVFVLPFEPV